jgi:hypothetical protein
LIALDLAMALDPALLMDAMGLPCDKWQADLLRSNAKRILMNCARQSGKSSVMGVQAAHTALYQPGSLVLLLSPTLRQSQELFRKTLRAYHAAGATLPADAETKLTLELNNGSRVVSLPGKEGTIRGYSGVTLLIIDEASRVPDELYMSVRPMLAVSGGRLIAPSTPYGTRGWWYEAWSGPEAWERVEVPATECARISAEFLAEERRTVGEWWFNQEYMCEFLDAQSAAFRREDIDRAFSEEVQTWDLLSA